MLEDEKLIFRLNMNVKVAFFLAYTYYDVFFFQAFMP